MHWRWVWIIAIYVLLLSGGWYLGQWLDTVPAFAVLAQNETRVHHVIVTATLVFIVASALPFVPGAEIGFALIMILGAKVAWLVYVSMVFALMIAFAFGRLVPARSASRAFAFFGLERARRLADELAPLTTQERLDMLISIAPDRIVPALLRNRYLTLALLLNIPGNSVLGGGGGIAFAAGITGLFSLPLFFLTLLIAVAPVPLFFVISSAGG